ncbi:MAG: hypothetical protein LH628_07890 [Microcoleus sp. CAN_BIN18]|nr:hypothetical protein [Microcoleus sp. CAN_BIN18]
METSANLAAGGYTGIGGFLTFADRAVRSHLSEMLDSGQRSTIGYRRISPLLPITDC